MPYENSEEDSEDSEEDSEDSFDNADDDDEWLPVLRREARDGISSPSLEISDIVRRCCYLLLLHALVLVLGPVSWCS